MKVFLENYRGWDISFDTASETFYCHSENNDKDEYRKSFTATKKWIDEFMKENNQFKPVFAERIATRYEQYDKIKLIGIRKDGRFVYEDEKGSKKQLWDYVEKDYILYNEENEKYKSEAEELKKQYDEIYKKREVVLSKIKGISLVDYKKQLLGK